MYQMYHFTTDFDQISAYLANFLRKYLSNCNQIFSIGIDTMNPIFVFRSLKGHYYGTN